jgi:hypothetical protein
MWVVVQPLLRLSVADRDHDNGPDVISPVTDAAVDSVR